MYKYQIDCHNLNENEYNALIRRLDTSFTATRYVADRIHTFHEEEPDEKKIRKTYGIPDQCSLRRL